MAACVPVVSADVEAECWVMNGAATVTACRDAGGAAMCGEYGWARLSTVQLGRPILGPILGSQYGRHSPVVIWRHACIGREI